jgi:peptide chain release factor 1
MLEKLAGIEERYEEINRQLMEVGNDYQRAADLSKERSDIEELVQKAREYRAVLKNLEEAKSLLENETDMDMRSLAEMEMMEAGPKI